MRYCAVHLEVRLMVFVACGRSECQKFSTNHRLERAYKLEPDPSRGSSESMMSTPLFLPRDLTRKSTHLDNRRLKHYCLFESHCNDTRLRSLLLHPVTEVCYCQRTTGDHLGCQKRRGVNHPDVGALARERPGGYHSVFVRPSGDVDNNSKSTSSATA